ncbi:hypothetical protein [Gemmobacter serpentinus]|uniref:hypothetical protein n=1 Tax=Gemmobacter serpentinus TaxID=2652247 RepID=UPI00124CDF2A|nr:hypothetical protein [Gemmobacter serpentinus]
MRRSALSLFALAPLALVACGPTVPESGAGVGFGDYDSYNAQREAALTNGAPMVAPGAQPIMGSGVGAQAIGGTPVAPATGFSTDRIGAAIDSASGGASVGVPAAGSGFVGTAPLVGAPTDPLAPVPMNPTPMAPSTLAPTVAPAAPTMPVQNLPTRAGNSANIVQYALTTTNSVGQSMYDRPSLTMRNPEKACAAFSSPDQAQAAFLDAGGPQKDRKGLDPDGDGFACAWDPSRFRKAVQ